MDELTAFIGARLDEGEAAAQAAGGSGPQGTWAQVDPERRPGRIDCDSGYVVTYDEGAPDDGQAPHIARHDPARVLREVAAMRAIVAAHPVRPILNGTCRTCSDREGLSWSSLEAADPHFVDWPCPTLRNLAAAWSDHPDYRQEWAPDGLRAPCE